MPQRDEFDAQKAPPTQPASPAYDVAIHTVNPRTLPHPGALPLPRTPTTTARAQHSTYQPTN